jgi:hypothetical protein
MKCSPILLIAAAAVAALTAGQSLVPTAKAQSLKASPDYQVRVDWQKTERGLSGLVIQGRLSNTGRKPLVYTQVTPTLVDANGNEVFRGRGYLTISPLLPGHSAEFRACEAAAPKFAAVRMVFHEAGHLVVMETPPVTTHVTAHESVSQYPAKVARGL